MTMHTNSAPVRIQAHEVLFPNHNTIRAIAHSAINNMVDATVDLVMDNELLYPTKTDMEKPFQSLHTMAAEMIEAALDDLKTQLLAELSQKRYTAQITGLDYRVGGELADIRVLINFD